MPPPTLARYRSIANSLRDQIAHRRFPPGAKFPTERELVLWYTASRTTVREALRILEDEGLIGRSRGATTRVLAPPGVTRRQLSNLEEILRYAADTDLDFDSAGVQPLGHRHGAALGRDPAERWLRLDGRRTQRDTGELIALTTVFLPAFLHDRAEAFLADGEPIFRQVEAMLPTRITQVTQEIRAVEADAQSARALGIAPRAPCLSIVRAFLSPEGETLEISLNLHPADRFAYAMHFAVS